MLQKIDGMPITSRAGRKVPGPEIWEIPELQDFPEAPAPRKLRFEGTICGSEVEVRGSGAVVVTEDEIVITTSDATIRIRKRK